MSHVVTVKAELKDQDALAAAVAKLGGKYDKTATNWRWYGKWVNDYHADDAAYKNGVDPKRYGTADAGVITIPGCSYDIGVYKTEKGFALVYDNWNDGMGLERVLGKGTPDLYKMYGVEVATKRCKKMGFQPIVKIDKDAKTGRINPRITATKR